MKRYFCLSILILSAFCASGKNPKKQITASDTTVYTVVDKMPEFPGGKDSLDMFLTRHFVWPTVLLESGVQGRIGLHFIVEKNGQLTHIVVFREVTPAMNKEAVRLFSIMPNWIPGEKNGKKVRVYQTFLFNFTKTAILKDNLRE